MGRWSKMSILSKLSDFNTKYLGFKIRDVMYVVVILGVLFYAWRLYTNLDNNVQQTHIAYKQLTETLARAQNDMVTKSALQEFAKKIGIDLGNIKKDLGDVNAKLIAVGETIVSINQRIDANQSPDHQEDHEPPTQPSTCTLCDIFGYTSKRVATDIFLGEMPIGEVWFDASRGEPFTNQYDAIDVKVDTAIGQQPDSENQEGAFIFYHTVSLLNKSRPDLAGKEFKLRVTSSEFKQLIEKTTQFYWWAPHLDLGVDNSFMFGSGSLYDPGASLGLTIMGYGHTKNDLEWKFIRIGAGLNLSKEFYLTLQPVTYNIGQFIPLLSDLWIGLGAVWDLGNAWGISLSISTTL